MKHTPTPWYCDGDGVYSNVDCEGAPLAHVLSMGYDNDFRNIDARRIVAAVNACRDIETEVLEMETGSTALFGRIAGKLTSENMRLRDSVSDVTAQRDELLAVLEAMLEEVAGCYCTTEAEARAVIQKVRGGE